MTPSSNSASANEPVRWGRQRWLAAIVLIFLTHVALIVVFNRRPTSPLPPTQFGMRLVAAEDAEARRHLADNPTLPDPTLFAAPSLPGFSGQAWLAFALPEHKLADWSEPPRWLDLEGAELAKTFVGYAAQLTNRSLLVADLPMPRLVGLDLPVPNHSICTQSLWRLEGQLARRSLLTPLQLRSWRSQELLTNSVVQLTVDGDGNTLFALLLSESGSKEADRWAVRAAAQTQFEPLQSGGSLPRTNLALSIGTLVFQWHTVFVDTNEVVKTP